MTNPASTSPKTLYEAGVWLHTQGNGVIGRRPESQLSQAEIDQLRRFENAARDVYEQAVRAAAHSSAQPWLVNVPAGTKDYGRDAAFNFGTLTAAAGARASNVANIPRLPMEARVTLANEAVTQYTRAIQGFNAARHDQDGRANDRVEAHVEFATSAVGLAGARTANGFDVGAVGIRLQGGRLQVTSAQLQQLDDAAIALRTAQQRDDRARGEGRRLTPHDAEALRRIPDVLAAEQAQRLATMQAFTQGAIAALSPATQGTIASVTGADAATMGHVTAFAVAIRQAVVNTRGPEGDALRALYANPTAWTNAWTAYLQTQVDATAALGLRNSQALTSNLAKARSFLAGR